MRNHHIFLFILLLLTSSQAWGQNPNLPTEEVDVIKDFNARLMETEKIDLHPELPPLDTMTKRQTYSVTEHTLNVEYLPPKIRPIAFKEEDNTQFYRGFARLGGGFPKSLYADVNYAIANSEKFNLDVDLFHYSANNDANLENQRFSLTDVGLGGRYYFDQGFAVRGDLGYKVNNVFFYGYNDFDTDTTEISFAKDDVKQRISLFTASGEIFNSEATQADFNYSAGLDFYLLQDNYSVRENGFNLNVKGTKWFNESHPLQVIIRADLTSYRDTSKQSLNNFFFTPSYTYHGDFWRAKVGINIASSDNEWFFFPDIEIGVNVIANILTAYAGAEGSLQKNNFRNLSDYNPFVSSRVKVENTNYNNFYGGIRGKIWGMDYDAQVSYKKANNLALFLSDQDTIPRFDVVYDTVSIFQIKGQASVPLFQNLSLVGTISQNFYTPKGEEKAWHLPSFSATVGATLVTLEDKLTLKGNFFIQNGVPYRTAAGEAKNLNPLLDLSIGGEYLFTEHIGAFVQVNNILNNKRERWQHYPVLGLNALVGVSAKF